MDLKAVPVKFVWGTCDVCGLEDDLVQAGPERYVCQVCWWALVEETQGSLGRVLQR